MIANGDQRRWTAQDPTNSKACWRMIISCSMHVQGLKKDQIWRNMVVSIQYNGCLLVKPSWTLMFAYQIHISAPQFPVSAGFFIAILAGKKSPFLLVKSPYFCWQKITISIHFCCLKITSPGLLHIKHRAQPAQRVHRSRVRPSGRMIVSRQRAAPKTAFDKWLVVAWGNDKGPVDSPYFHTCILIVYY